MTEVSPRILLLALCSAVQLHSTKKRKLLLVPGDLIAEKSSLGTRGSSWGRKASLLFCSSFFHGKLSVWRRPGLCLPPQAQAVLAAKLHLAQVQDFSLGWVFAFWSHGNSWDNCSSKRGLRNLLS